MKAIVLAGGLGTRLHPLTVNLPKPMVPVANRPLMEYVIELLKKHNFKETIVLLYYQPEIIKNHFGDGKKFGVKISYLEASEDFGTAGAVKFALQNLNLKESFLVISADLITDFDLTKISEFHKEKKAFATMVLTRVANPLPYGIVVLNKEGRIKHFLEKPSWSEVFSDTINCGIYILEPEVLDYIPPERPFDFSQDLFPALLEEKLPLYGYIAEGLWQDIGNLIEYRKINQDLGGGASVIGKNCQIASDAVLKESVIWDRVMVGSEARLEKAVVANNTIIGDRSFLEEGVVVGEGCHIGKDVNLKPFIKIWPNKIIEEGAEVSRSMVWRERWTKGIFGPYGVTGLCNVEVTPEFAAAMGAAYGTLLGKGTQVVASRDSHKSSRMIYRALISGVLSSGVNISNLEDVPIPINRYEIRSLKSKGGIHVRKSPYDPGVIDIKFFDEDGMDLKNVKEKKVERFFFGEDFARVGIEETGELSFPYHRVAQSYKEGILSYVEVEPIKNANFKIVVDYAYGSASKIFPSILGELGVEVIALNAHSDETKITKTKVMFERELHQLSSIVKSLEADLGIALDTGAEKIFLCDEKGQILLGDLELAVVSLLILKGLKKGVVAVPIKASRVIDILAKKYGIKVFRTKNSFRAMTEAAARSEVSFLGEPLGGFIFPGFQPSFDAMFSVVKILELLSKNKIKISEVVSEIPKIAMASKEISCPLEAKGKVLRYLVDESRDEEVDLTDGVKVFFGEPPLSDWLLVLPDPVRSTIHLYAEATGEKEAQKLIQEYVKKIDSIL